MMRGTPLSFSDCAGLTLTPWIAAKRRLIYTLINFSLPLPTAASGDGEPLIFDFLANPPNTSMAPKVMTGHNNGIITLSLVEADDAIREQLRVSMGEPYRMLLGHFRHEIGHYYWDKLVRDGGEIGNCRALFGDESANYEEALARHYTKGALPTWQQSFVSAYATSHRGKISPKPSRIISILSIHWRPRALLVFAPGPRFPTVMRFAQKSISNRIAVGIARARALQSNHGCLASVHLGDELHQSINGTA
jgi:Putative zinc-binding metallo-peptidase